MSLDQSNELLRVTLDEAKAIGSSGQRQLSQEKSNVVRKFENLTAIASIAAWGDKRETWTQTLQRNNIARHVESFVCRVCQHFGSQFGSKTEERIKLAKNKICFDL